MDSAILSSFLRKPYDPRNVSTRAVMVFVTTASPAVVGCHRGCLLPPAVVQKLAKYKRDSGKWKMPTRNVETYAAIPIPQRARADEGFTRPLAWQPCLNRTLRRNTTG